MEACSPFRKSYVHAGTLHQDSSILVDDDFLLIADHGCSVHEASTKLSRQGPRTQTGSIRHPQTVIDFRFVSVVVGP